MPFTAETLRAMRDAALAQAERAQKQTKPAQGTAEFWFHYQTAEIFLGLAEIFSAGLRAEVERK